MSGEDKIKISVGFGTDKGLVRDMNEDSFTVFVPYPGSEDKAEFQAVLGVADGMGGHRGGSLASHFITDRINKAFVRGEYVEKFGNLEDLSLVLRYVLQEINRDLFATSKKSAGLVEIGSTLTLGLFKDACLYLVHVGDSRCYAIRDSSIEQLTKDHSWVAEQLRSGLLTKAEAAGHPNQNILTQAVGFDANIEPQVIVRPVKKGDKFVFCSDGLSNLVAPEEILGIVGEPSSPQRACDTLIRLAMDRGAPDNVTVVLGYAAEDLADTKAEEVPKRMRAGRRRFRISSRVIIAAIMVVLAAAFFWLGWTVHRAEVSRNLRPLWEQVEVAYKDGPPAEVKMMLDYLFKIDKNNKQAQAILEKYGSTGSGEKRGEK